MTISNLNKKQVERQLGQQIQALYQAEIGQRPAKVTCQFFDDKLAIVLENVLTRPEQLLIKNQRGDLAEKLRSQLDEALKPQMLQLVEECTGIPVSVVLAQTSLNSDISGIIVVLAGVF